MAAAKLRATWYEDKVVDFLFGNADISDREASRADLEAAIESEDGHVHGPGCGHDHDHDHKPAKKAAAKKAPAKAKAAEKLAKKAAAPKAEKAEAAPAE